MITSIINTSIIIIIRRRQDNRYTRIAAPFFFRSLPLHDVLSVRICDNQFPVDLQPSLAARISSLNCEPFHKTFIESSLLLIAGSTLKVSNINLRNLNVSPFSSSTTTTARHHHFPFTRAVHEAGVRSLAYATLTSISALSLSSLFPRQQSSIKISIIDSDGANEGCNGVGNTFAALFFIGANRKLI